MLCLVLVWSCQRFDPDRQLLQGRQALRRGEQDLAQRIADRGARSFAQPESSPYWGFRLLQAEVLLNRGQVPAAERLLTDPVPPRPELALLEARRLLYQGIAAFRVAQSDRALKVLEKAKEKAGATRRPEILLEIAVARGAVLAQMKRSSEAEATLQTALPDAVRQRDRYEESLILGALGLRRIWQARYDEAVPFVERSLKAATEIDARRLRSAALTNLGLCYYRLGDFDRSNAALEEAIELQRKLGLQIELQASLGTLGDAQLLQGEPSKAARQYRMALEIAERLQAKSYVALWTGNLASALIDVGDWDGAEELNRHSLSLKQQLGEESWHTYTTLNTAAIATGRGDLRKAEELYREVLQNAGNNSGVTWDAHAGLGRVYGLGKRRADAIHEYQQAIDTIESTRAGLLERDFKITFLSHLIRFYQDYVALLVKQGADGEALRVAESSRARMLLRKSVPAQSGKTAARYHEAAKRSGDIFLSYWLSPETSLVWVITPSGITCVPLPRETEIASLVARYNKLLQVPREASLLSNPAGQELYRALLEPVHTLIPRGSRVVVVPDGVLHSLNFETIPVPGNSPHYWIQDVTLAVAPSLEVLLMASAPQAPVKSLLLVGNPEAVSPEYPVLPHASEELRSIEGRFPAETTRVLAGAKASPRDYREARPDEFRFIHFAAHGVANRTSPLESAVVLSKRDSVWKLYARDVADSPLRADLVTLSACRSAGSRAYAGEGLVGFAWAFLNAGAKNVIAGLWDVGDSSTAQLMDRLYRGIEAGLPPEEALRQAKLAFLASGGNYRKPFYWAPFQLYTRTLMIDAMPLRARRN